MSYDLCAYRLTCDCSHLLAQMEEITTPHGFISGLCVSADTTEFVVQGTCASVCLNTMILMTSNNYIKCIVSNISGNSVLL